MVTVTVCAFLFAQEVFVSTNFGSTYNTQDQMTNGTTDTGKSSKFW